MGSAQSIGSSADDAKRHIGEGGSNAMSSMRQAPGNAVHAAEGRVEGSPMAAGLVAFGIGFLAGSLLPNTRSESDLAQRLEPDLEHITRDIAHGAKEATDELVGVAKDEAAAVGDEVSDAAGTVKESAQQHASEATDEMPSGRA